MIYDNRLPQSQYFDQNASSSSQSSCSQCKKNQQYNKKNSFNPLQRSQCSSQHQHSHKFNQYQQQAERILHNNIKQNNNHFERSLQIMKMQIQQLRKENYKKDKMIKDMQIKYQIQRREEYIKKQIEKEKEIEMLNKNTMSRQEYNHRYMMQLGCSPRNVNQGNNRNFRSNLTLNTAEYKQNNLSMSPQYPMTMYIPNESPNQNSQLYQDNPSNRFHGYLSNRVANTNNIVTSPRNQLNSQPNNLYNFQQQQLKIKLLQQQIRGYQQQLLKLQQIVTSLQAETQWHVKFINNFIKMCEQLSVNYGEKLILKKYQNNVKKQTKICWTYMKDLVSYFINQLKLNQQALNEIIQNTNKQREQAQQFVKKFI